MDLACAATRRMLLEPRRDQLPDPAPERIGVNVPFGVPDLASLTDRAITNNPVTSADDTGVLLKIDVRPLLHQIGLRERAPPIQRRLEGRDELCHRPGSAATARVTKTRSMCRQAKSLPRHDPAASQAIASGLIDKRQRRSLAGWGASRGESGEAGTVAG